MNDAPIAASHLGKYFAGRRVLHDLSFAVAPGDVVGVLGKNGAGKTTLLQLMLGFTPASEGEVSLFGHQSYRLPAAAKARVGFVPQQDELLGTLRVGEQLQLIAAFHAQWDQALIARLCGEWGVDVSARIGSLSVGDRQKLSILLALGHRPELLILDEPVASLDPVARRQFLQQIVEIAADRHRSVVFSSHIVSDVERLANRIWILKEGRLYWQGDLDELKESIVRLHLRSITALPAALTIPRALSVRREASHATVIARDWNDAAHRELQRQFDGDIAVESLALEEIFLELHR